MTTQTRTTCKYVPPCYTAGRKPSHMCTLSYWSGVQNVLASIIVQSIWKHGWRVWGTSTQAVENKWWEIIESFAYNGQQRIFQNKVEVFLHNLMQGILNTKHNLLASVYLQKYFLHSALPRSPCLSCPEHPGPKRTDKDRESGGDAHMLQRIWKREYCNPWNILKRYIFIFPCSQLTSLSQKILERRFTGRKKEIWWKPCQDPLKVIFDLHIHKATKTSFCWVLFSRSHVPNTHTAHTFLDTLSVILAFCQWKSRIQFTRQGSQLW